MNTDAAGAFNFDSSSNEDFSVTPYLVIRACLNETSCYMKKFMDEENRAKVKNGSYFMDDDFCQHCKGGGECKSLTVR
jgi:hypothetical protein